MVPGGVAYDVGAYVGYLTMVMSRCAGPDGTVVAFEASPRVLPALNANLAADEFTNTEIVDRAVSDQSGTLSFEMYPYSTIGRISRDGTADDAVTVEVQAITLDEYVYELGNPPPDLIKIDVNGAELQVLQGADRLLREQAPKVLVEVRTRTQSEVMDLMAAAGYRARHLEAEDQVRPTCTTSSSFPTQQRGRPADQGQAQDPRFLGWRTGATPAIVVRMGGRS